MSNQQTNTTANQTACGSKLHNSMGEGQDIKFNKYNVTNKKTKAKARVHYSLDNRGDGKKCVTLYVKDYGYALRDVIPNNYENDTDTMTDYFDKGRAVLFEGHPLYAAARKAVESFKAK